MVAEVKQSPWIPFNLLQELRVGHAIGRDLLLNHGIQTDEIEEVAIAEMVEAHRWAWKPKKVRLLLIAESHVYTKADEAALDYGTANYFPKDLNIPSQYVRLIYCLGYGEKLLAPNFDGGTPQFWKIFGDLCGTQPKHQSGAPKHKRLNEKLRTLRILSDQGVWLVDASLHAVSLRNGRRLDFQIVQSLQKQWWEHYGELIIEQERPERIVAIGKGVYSSLKHRIGFHRWIYQPQGIRSFDQKCHNVETLTALRSWLESKL